MLQFLSWCFFCTFGGNLSFENVFYHGFFIKARATMADGITNDFRYVFYFSGDKQGKRGMKPGCGVLRNVLSRCPIELQAS
jgi:hypothetical protein